MTRRFYRWRLRVWERRLVREMMLCQAMQRAGVLVYPEEREPVLRCARAIDRIRGRLATMEAP